MVAVIHKITWLVWPDATVYLMRVTRIKTIMAQNSPCLSLCYISYPRNSVYLLLGLCTASQNITFPTSVLFMFCTHLQQETGLLQSSVCSLKSFVMSHSVKWISMPLFHHSSPTTSWAETIREMHVRMFVCKYYTFWSIHHTATQHNPQPLPETMYDQEYHHLTTMSAQFTST